jgi:glycosyltransferase involved in cell wall biosynthesis
VNKALMIVSNFPPVRNGGTIRGEKLAKYLPRYGWSTIVITKSPPKKTDYNYRIDIPYCKVYRTNPVDLTGFLFYIKVEAQKFIKQVWPFIERNTKQVYYPINKTVVKRRFSEFIFIPDTDILWALASIPRVLYIMRKEKPRIIFSSGPAQSTHILGYFLKIISRKKWIVEFRDPWTMNPFSIEKPFKIFTKLDNYFEKVVLINADQIIVTSKEYKTQFLNKYQFISHRKIKYIPNGYDPDDFLKIHPYKNSKFTIVHSGNFYQKRESSTFIHAVIYLLESKKLESKNLEVRFVGKLDNEGIELIAKSRYKKNFTQVGQVSHVESIREISMADLLLLVPGPGEGTMPGKFYEYLAISKPIFCIAEDGPVKKIMENYNIGITVKKDDLTVVANKLLGLVEAIKSKNFIYPDIKTLLHRYNRKVIAEQVATAFTKLTGSS